MAEMSKPSSNHKPFLRCAAKFDVTSNSLLSVDGDLFYLEYGSLKRDDCNYKLGPTNKRPLSCFCIESLV